jgi:hypothetical protein
MSAPIRSGSNKTPSAPRQLPHRALQQFLGDSHGCIVESDPGSRWVENVAANSYRGDSRDLARLEWWCATTICDPTVRRRVGNAPPARHPRRACGWRRLRQPAVADLSARARPWPAPDRGNRDHDACRLGASHASRRPQRAARLGAKPADRRRSSDDADGHRVRRARKLLAAPARRFCRYFEPVFGRRQRLLAAGAGPARPDGD